MEKAKQYLFNHICDGIKDDPKGKRPDGPSMFLLYGYTAIQFIDSDIDFNDLIKRTIEIAYLEGILVDGGFGMGDSMYEGYTKRLKKLLDD